MKVCIERQWRGIRRTSEAIARFGRNGVEDAFYVWVSIERHPEVGDTVYEMGATTDDVAVGAPTPAERDAIEAAVYEEWFTTHEPEDRDCIEAFKDARGY